MPRSRAAAAEFSRPRRLPTRVHPRVLLFALTTLHHGDRARAIRRLARAKEAIMDWISARALYRSAAAWLPRSYATALRLALLDKMLADAPEKLLSVEASLRRIMRKFKGKCAADPDRVAASTLALLLYQRGADELGNEIARELNCTHRLAPRVLNYAPVLDSVAIGSSLHQSEYQKYVQAVDDAFPDALLEHMKESFSQTSPFWREHDYCPSPPSPYFSYLHVIPTQPSNALEQVLAYAFKITCEHFPKAREAKYAEWWAHCRPHCSGHQMHFDSDDEGRGGVRNPIISTVLFIDGCIGGPTLVTNQHFGSKELGSKGWLVHPRSGRFVMFDATTLHGVIPGAGHSKDIHSRRITFMCAFWKDIKFRQPHVRLISHTSIPSALVNQFCACMPFPNLSDLKTSWNRPHLSQLRNRDELENHGSGVAIQPVRVEPIWMPLSEHSSASLPTYDQCFQGF